MAVGRFCGVVIARPAFALVSVWLQVFSRRRAVPLSRRFYVGLWSAIG